MAAPIDKGILSDPDLLSKEQIEDLLPMLDELIDWAKKVQEYALNQALTGVEYKGYKVVEGRTKRRLTDEEGAVKALVSAGYASELFYERKVIAFNKMEALVGKKNFTNIVGEFIEKPKGAPALVPDDDPREPYQASAAEDFNDGFTD